MPLSWNDIRTKAIAFSRKWKEETSEDAEAKSFWDGFFEVFGISRYRLASFEKPVRKSDGKGGYIDLLWKGVLLVEHKSFGCDLDSAFRQATDYFAGLKEKDLPRYVVVSDFARMRLYDLAEDSGTLEFKLEDLHKHIHSFGFIAGYETRSFGHQDPVNIRAAESLGKLHDLLKASGYDGHPLELFLVRLLFCLFADRNDIFEGPQFREWIEQRTADDGSDLGPLLSQLFQALDKPEDRRQKNLDEHIAAFRYINGKLFEEITATPALDRPMREMILKCAALDWSRISPAIFGALFQSIMDKEARRSLGAHYTSETNILKALKPLFLDTLRAEFERARRSHKQLEAFHDKLRTIRVLDPACGCGNFLVIAYRELRLLEMDVLSELFKSNLDGRLDISNIVFVDVDQMYGIEVEEFPAQIAQVALWMTDHQMNQRVSSKFGQYFARLPLRKAPNIMKDNALRRDWDTVVSPEALSYIVGNPPFSGKSEQSAEQKSDMKYVYRGAKNAGVLDYVACWYTKAVRMMQANPSIRIALVSTNSITQGEQVAALWPQLFAAGASIFFAHRTFEWSSEARGKAAVHCVIIGLTAEDNLQRTIYEYQTPRSQPHAVPARNINAYLIDAPNLFLPTRTKPLFNSPVMVYGSKPVDGSGAKRAKGEKKVGNLVLTSEERAAWIAKEPNAADWMRPYLGSDELINGDPRWCLWLGEVSPIELNRSPEAMRRLAKVQEFRLASTKKPTRMSASTPSIFTEVRQPASRYLAVPEVSSERRTYIPAAFLEPEVIASNLLYTVPSATVYDFGVFTSVMHMAWVRVVCGRLKSDYRYSAGIVYNNFPWPEPTPKHRRDIETAAQRVLDERANHRTATLGVLYNPILMPPALVEAHRLLDRAVDLAYGRVSFSGEGDRAAFLFQLYEKRTSMFPGVSQSRRTKR